MTPFAIGCRSTKPRLGLFPAITLATLAVAILPAAEAAAATRYGSVCVTNKTQARISYRFQVGDGSWQVRVMGPGEARVFTHKYDKLNENSSPPLRIEFDTDVRSNKNFATKYKLPRKAAEGDSCAEGAQYHFLYEKNRNFIDLKKV